MTRQYEQAGKDGNHNAIRDALRYAGLVVEETHQFGQGYPDLTIGARQAVTIVGRGVNQNEIRRRLADVPNLTIYDGAVLPLEVKTPKGKLTESQVKFFARFQDCPILIARTIDEALAVCGVQALV